VLAGDSVHFDLGFVRYHMPTLAKRLSHRVYDVSAIKLFCRSLGMPKIERKEDPVHRAAGDVLRSIEHAKYCADWLARNWRGIYGLGTLPSCLPDTAPCDADEKKRHDDYINKLIQDNRLPG
jgi:hypothetical protein